MIKIKKVTTKAPLGLIVYQGPSVLEPETEIVVIATLTSKNEKTGNMVQLWIFVDGELSPHEIAKQGLDASICGHCVHKTTVGGTCYVDLSRAPNAIWKSYKKGNYPAFNSGHARHLSNRKIRLGAYGDPAAVPYSVLKEVTDISMSFTGYTHQAHHKNFDSRVASFCMVSVDTPRQAIRYQEKGYRTFRVALEQDEVMENELQCLNTTQDQLQCIDCGLCDGLNRASKSIAIAVHGSRKNSFKSSLIDVLQVA